MTKKPVLIKRKAKARKVVTRERQIASPGELKLAMEESGVQDVAALAELTGYTRRAVWRWLQTGCPTLVIRHLELLENNRQLRTKLEGIRRKLPSR